MSKSQLEATLAIQIALTDLPMPSREWRFHPTRKWRLDFCWPDLKIAAEVDGGTWKQTRTGRSAGHAHPARMQRDNEKRNAARALGWRVFQFTGHQVEHGEALEVLRCVLGGDCEQGDQ
jgi:very-short-patch-repair endonuclease